MNASGDNVEYSEAVMVWCITMIMHYYPKYDKEDIIEFIHSCSIKEYSITDINHLNFYGMNRWDVRLKKVDKYQKITCKIEVYCVKYIVL